MKETDLYGPLKDFFERQGYDVFSEVRLPVGTKRVDLIAHFAGSEHNTIAVEMKTSLSQDLVEQAIAHRSKFPYVYVAIPERKRRLPPKAQERLLFYGVGILEIVTLGDLQKVKVLQQAIFEMPKHKFRKPWDELLLPEHQTWLPGGSKGGGYVTDYSLTMRRVHDYLKVAKELDDMLKNVARHTEKYGHKNGWRSAAEILENCTTHWARPKSSLVLSLLEFEAKRVDAQKINGRWHFRSRSMGGET